MTSDHIELILKVLAVVASVAALYKAFQEIVVSKKPRLRDEFTFVKSFITDLKDETHPFLVEKGFLAIAGDPLLSAAEIRYILGLSSPSTALRRYLHSREHLVFMPAAPKGTKSIDFKPSLQSKKTRRVWKAVHLTSYALAASLAFAPLLFARTLFGSNWQAGLVAVSMMLVSFGWLAVSSLISASKLWRAEELVLQQ